MERKSNFFVCKRCGNLVNLIHSSGVVMSCCDERMENMEPKYTDEGGEKHTPINKKEGDVVRVDVGKIYHPMTEEHNIGWVALVTNKGTHRRILIHGEEPIARFHLVDELPIAAYSYCNKHGLWKTHV